MTTVEPGTPIFTAETQQDPYPLYAQLRESAPVYVEPQFGTYVLTRFDDVYGALKDHATFSSARGIAPGLSDSGAIMATMITSDPPRHTRLRALVNSAFTPRMIGRIEPWMRQVVGELLAGIEDDTDIVESLTYPLPVMVIARLLGIPESDHAQFKVWSDAVVGVTDFGVADTARDSIKEMFAYFSDVIASRSTEPRNDLISSVVHAEIDGEKLNERELLGFCLLLLVAGNETTTNLLGNMLAVLVSDPTLQQQLRDDPSQIPAAVEETLRYDSPVQALWRRTTRPVEMHGVSIPEDSQVLMGYAAANRDPRMFADPDTFRLDRQLNRHVAFGFGIHYCLGAPLARAEARIAIEELLRRYRRLGPGPTASARVPSSLLRGFSRLSITCEE
ncbi:MAG: cytochrome P450 [Dehalococcoidia bacterium]